MAGKSTGSSAFMKEVGIGSREQVFEFPDRMSFASLSIETLANDLSGRPKVFVSNLDVVVGCFSSSVISKMFSKSVLIFEILLEKDWPNLFARSLPDEELGRMFLLVLYNSSFAILNNFFHI